MRLFDLIKDGKKARFTFYRDRELWYTTDDGFEFPVPIRDIGNTTFMVEHKASELMKWIRKQMEMIEKEKAHYANNDISEEKEKETKSISPA